MQKALNRKKSPLPPDLRALITVKVSEINQCPFCIDFNASLLMERDRGVEVIESLKHYRESPLFSEGEKKALEYAESMTLAADKIPETLFEALHKHYDADAIVELTALIALQNLSSKFNAALDAKAFGFCKPPSNKS